MTSPHVVPPERDRRRTKRVPFEPATLARTDYYVALEFLDMTQEQSAAVRRIIQNN
jgi:hypothetical protein